MKPKNRFSATPAGTLLITLALAMLPQASRAADRIKQNNTTALNLAGSWDTLPDALGNDTGVWNNTITASNTTALGADLSWLGIKIANPTGVVTIGTAATNTLTLGTGGIDLSAASVNLVINSNLTAGDNQTWTLASGRTLQVQTLNTNTRLSGSGNISLVNATGSGTALFDLRPGSSGSVSFSDQFGFYSYTGNWTIGSGVEVRNLRNGRNAWGNGTITLNGGIIAQQQNFSGTWTNNIILQTGSSSRVEDRNTSGVRTLKLQGVISGDGTLTFAKNNSSTSQNIDSCYVLTGANTMSGTINIAGDAFLRVGGDGGNDTSLGAGTTGSLGTASVVTAGPIAFTRNNAHTVSSVISGSGSVNIGSNNLTDTTVGTGTATSTQVVTFSGANTYTAATNLNNGTAKAGVASIAGISGAFGNKSAMTIANVAGTTLDLNGFDTVVGSLAGGGTTGGTITNSAGTPATLTTGGLNANVTFAGVVSGGANLALTKNGLGTLTLTGTNTYTGATTVNGGKLVISGANATASVYLAPFATLNGTGSVAGTVTADEASNLETTGTLTMGSLTVLGGMTVTGGSLSTSAPAIATSGPLVTSQIPGSITLNFSTNGSLASGTYHLVTHTGGALSDDDFNAFTLGSAPALSGRQSGVLVNGATAVDYIVSGDTPKWTGKDGSVWTTGTTGALGNWKLITQGTSTDFVAGDVVLFDDSAANKTVTLSVADVAPGVVNVTNSNGNDYTFGGSFAIAGAASLFKDGTGSLIINNANTYTAGTTITAGAIQVGNNTALGTGAVVDNATLSFPGTGSITFANAISGSGVVSKTGAGTAILTNPASSYTGGTTVTSGELQAYVPIAAGAKTTLGTGTISVTAATVHFKTDSTSNAQSYPNSFTLNNGTFISEDGVVTYGGLVSLAGTNTFSVIYTAKNAVLPGVISGGGSLVKTSPGTLVISGINTFTGGTVVNAGTLQTSTNNGTANGALGTGNVVVNSGGTILAAADNSLVGQTGVATNTHAIQINAGGTVTSSGASCHLIPVVMNGGTLTASSPNTSFGNWNFDRGVSTLGGTATTSTISGGIVTLSQTGGTLFNVQGTDAINLSSTITGSGTALTKNGTGTLTVSGVNTFTGGTVVNGGKLIIANATGSATSTGTVTVAAAGTLGGTGIASGAVTVSGTLAPGISGIGGISTGALVLDSSSTAAIDISSTAVTSDVIHVTGNVTLGGGALVLTDLAPGTLASGSKLTLLTYTGSLSGTFNGLAEGGSVNVGSNSYIIRYNDTGAVTLTAGAADAYTTWSTAHGLTGADAAKDADPDHDGVKNVLEFLFGTEPNPANAGAGSLASLPTVTEDATMLHFVYHRASASVSSITPVVQYSSTLGGWTAATAGTNGVTIQTVTDGFGTGIDKVTVNIPLTLGSGGKLFARLFVAVP